MNADILLQHFERISEAPDAVPKLRRFILDLAVRGKLVAQDPSDESPLELMKRSGLKNGECARTSDSTLQIKHKLPSSWLWVRLEELFDYDSGRKVDPKEIPADAWLLELEDIEKDTGRIINRSKVGDRNPTSTKSEFQTGDVLYGKLRPYLNKVIVADFPGFSTTEIVAIRCRVDSCPYYTAIALRRPDFVKYVTLAGKGTKMPRLRSEEALNAIYPLPPIAEQYRIVAKVNELMALCDELESAQAKRESRRDRLVAATMLGLNNGDKITENGQALPFTESARFYFSHLPKLTTRPEHIKQLRQAILNLAMRGRLIQQYPQGSACAPVMPNFDKHPFNVPDGWTWTTLAALATFINGDRSSHYPSGGDIVDNGIPFINTTNITNGVVDLSPRQLSFITAEKFSQLRSGKLEDNDILIVLRGSVGKNGVFRANDRYTTGFINAQLVIIRLQEKGHIPYLRHFFDSDLFRHQILSRSTGSAQPQLSAGTLQSFLIPLPPIAQQRLIVAKTDALMSVCDELESQLQTVYSSNIKLLDALLHGTLAASVV